MADSVHAGPVTSRDYRDSVIEDLADRELALRHQWRVERAMLLDRLNSQRDEIVRLKAQLASQRAELMRYTPATVARAA